MDIETVAHTILFYACALTAVGASVGVAMSRNIVRSAFSLLASLLGVAGLYALAGADFLAGIQLLIYVGGILVLILFAVMLTHRIADVKLSNASAPGFLAVLVVVLVLVVLAMAVRATAWTGAGAGAGGATAAKPAPIAPADAPAGAGAAALLSACPRSCPSSYRSSSAAPVTRLSVRRPSSPYAMSCSPLRR